MSQNENANPNTNATTANVNANTSTTASAPTDTNKITAQETEKLRELLNNIKSLEAASEEAVAGGGAKIEDSMLDRAKRQLDSYTRYLEEKYDEPAETYVTNLETSDAAKAIENKEKSPSNVEGNK